jgi:hypothetical protein
MLVAKIFDMTNRFESVTGNILSLIKHSAFVHHAVEVISSQTQVVKIITLNPPFLIMLKLKRTFLNQ